MASGGVASSFYTFSGIVGKSVGSTEPVARMILNRFIGQNGHQNIIGSPLIGYDIKSQDSLTMLRLSLLAEDPDGMPELYTRPDGIVVKVTVGITRIDAPTKEDTLMETTTDNYVDKIDHVLVRARNTLPTRYSRPGVNAMGSGIVTSFRYNCTIGQSFKNQSSQEEAWAEYQRSMQHPTKQRELKERVRRSQWEELVGYRITMPSLPPHVSFSPSQTTPRGHYLPITSDLSARVTLQLGDTVTPEAGGIVDVSGISGVGIPILDIITGEELAVNNYSVDSAGTPVKLSNAAWRNLLDQEGLSNKLTFKDLYILLGTECGVHSISRGENWFLLPGSGNTAVVQLRRSPVSGLATRIRDLSYNRVFLRSNENNINSVTDGIQLNLNRYGRIFSGPADGMHTTNRSGVIIPGLGGTHGMELTSLILSYSIAKPSFKIQSPHGDAWFWARRVANGGVTYIPIVVQDIPAATGWSESLEPQYPPAPADREGEKYDVESELDELEGSIVELSAPFLDAQGAVGFAHKIKDLINAETGISKNISSKFGPYNALPGMILSEIGVGNIGFLKSVEFNYSDRDVQAVNLTTGPRYHPIGSYQDSQYIKRTESISRGGKVISGSNRTGTYFVSVEGLGSYEAFKSVLEPIYPGDRVDVTINNYPVEK